MKKQKEQNLFADQLAKGQDVATTSGILGKIVSIQGEIVHLEIAPKTVIRCTKSAISRELTDAVSKNKALSTPVETTA